LTFHIGEIQIGVVGTLAIAGTVKAERESGTTVSIALIGDVGEGGIRYATGADSQIYTICTVIGTGYT
jgi:hypothetical protein